MSEIIRAGLLSVDPGQELAARALGMTRPRILRRVIVPQAIRIIIPPTERVHHAAQADEPRVRDLAAGAADGVAGAGAVDFRYPEAYGAALVYYLVIVSVLMVVQASSRGDTRGARPGGGAAPRSRGRARRAMSEAAVLRADGVHKRTTGSRCCAASRSRSVAAR